jgi:hypothetical protein
VKTKTFAACGGRGDDEIAPARSGCQGLDLMAIERMDPPRGEGASDARVEAWHDPKSGFSSRDMPRGGEARPHSAFGEPGVEHAFKARFSVPRRFLGSPFKHALNH